MGYGGRDRPWRCGGRVGAPVGGIEAMVWVGDGVYGDGSGGGVVMATSGVRRRWCGSEGDGDEGGDDDGDVVTMVVGGRNLAENGGAAPKNERRGRRVYVCARVIKNESLVSDICKVRRLISDEANGCKYSTYLGSTRMYHDSTHRGDRLWRCGSRGGAAIGGMDAMVWVGDGVRGYGSGGGVVMATGGVRRRWCGSEVDGDEGGDDDGDVVTVAVGGENLADNGGAAPENEKRGRRVYVCAKVIKNEVKP
ncbi:hypothetical protein Tco_0532210 [Tanacetum coccineum]